MCHDHSPRCGFLHDGVYTSVHCWNCGIKAKYEEGSGRLSRNFRQILEAFGITKDDLIQLKSGVLAKPVAEPTITLSTLSSIKLHAPEVQLPERSLPIGADGYEELQLPIAEYLLSRRIDPVSVKAHFSTDPRYSRRAIIPFFRDGKIIYWQARSIDQVKPRYLNCSVSRDAVMYNTDKLFTYDERPLFIFEGVFDAMVLDGVCLLGSSINAGKMDLLKRSRRNLVFVIDRDRTGHQLGKVAIENGWRISFVDAAAKDANDSVCRYGLPYTVYRLMKNCTSQFNPTVSHIQLGLGVTQAKLGRFL